MKLHIKVKGDAPFFEESTITDVETGDPVTMFGFDLTVRAGDMATLNAQIVDVETDMTVDVGTLSSFSNEDLVAEIYRRQPSDCVVVNDNSNVATSLMDMSPEATEIIKSAVRGAVRTAAEEAGYLCTCPSLAAGHLPDCKWKAART